MASRLPLALAACALLVGGCRTLGLRKDPELTYAQVQAVQLGLTAEQVIDAFGPPARSERRPDGTARLFDYAALDGRENAARLLLEFDERGVLVSKRFSGAVVAPR